MVLLRSVCCESYKICGNRCAVCPNRLENQALAQQSQASCGGGRCGRSCEAHQEHTPHAQRELTVFAVTGD
jgi:hypothetical protein